MVGFAARPGSYNMIDIRLLRNNPYMSQVRVKFASR
jgi:hypothetical protein